MQSRITLCILLLSSPVSAENSFKEGRKKVGQGFTGVPQDRRGHEHHERLGKPGVYVGYNTTIANRNLPANPQRVLLIGQRRAAGTVAALATTLIFSDSDAAGYFGAGSMLHLMCRAAIKANPYVDLTAIAVDDSGAGIAATGTITITGPATGSGLVGIWIGQRLIQIAVASTDTANAIATALKTAFGNVGDVPVTATVNNAVVTLTARNKGTCGNGIVLSVDTSSSLPSGVTVAIVAMAIRDGPFFNSHN